MSLIVKAMKLILRRTELNELYHNVKHMIIKKRNNEIYYRFYFFKFSFTMIYCCRTVALWEIQVDKRRTKFPVELQFCCQMIYKIW